MTLRLFALTLMVSTVSWTPQTPVPQAAARKLSQPSPAQESRPAAQAATAGPSGWVWIKVSNNVAHYWDTETGVADVQIAGEKFSAKLYWKDDPATLRILLEGKIRDGKITAVETVQASDYTGSTYTGTFVKREYVQTINLSDGFGMIGITRPLKQ